MRELSRVPEIFYILFWIVVTRVSTYIKNSLPCTLRLMYLTLYVLCLKLKKTKLSVALHYYYRLKAKLLRLAHGFLFISPSSLGSNIFL